ncbi:hypothetical protein Vretifemale_4757, partial [Volvox reticuliferus]
RVKQTPPIPHTYACKYTSTMQSFVNPTPPTPQRQCLNDLPKPSAALAPLTSPKTFSAAPLGRTPRPPPFINFPAPAAGTHTLGQQLLVLKHLHQQVQRQ